MRKRTNNKPAKRTPSGKRSSENASAKPKRDAFSSDSKKSKRDNFSSAAPRKGKPYRKKDEASDEKKSDRPVRKFKTSEVKASGKKFSKGTSAPSYRDGQQSGSDKVRLNRYRKQDETSDEKKTDRPVRKFKTSEVKTSGKKFSKATSAPSYKDGLQTGSDKIRLNRFIANSGLCSRREADEYISMGLVTVNGKTITELGYKVNITDDVRYEGKKLKAEKPVYILMNKPKGFLTTTKDPQERNTVMHIIANSVRERVYPVGRLDRNTTGLLLLTNDGDLAEKLSHPSYNVRKIYKVELDRPIAKADFIKIQEGVQLEEGRARVDDVAIVSDDKKTIGVEIHIGWNRVVRRIFEKLEYEVVKLDRTVYAGLDKKELARGQWRFLSPEEVIRLKHLGKK